MEMHADGEMVMLNEEESEQKNLWGINIHPELKMNEMIEFDSMINIRPSQGNRSRSIDSKEMQEKIKKIVFRLVEK